LNITFQSFFMLLIFDRFWPLEKFSVFFLFFLFEVNSRLRSEATGGGFVWPVMSCSRV